MPDISMCANQDCPSKEKCYRFKAAPYQYQSYMEFKPLPRRKKCDHFMLIHIRPGKKEE